MNYTIKEVSELLGESKSTITKAIKRLKLGKPFGKAVMLSIRDIEKLRKRNRKPGNPGIADLRRKTLEKKAKNI